MIDIRLKPRILNEKVMKKLENLKILRRLAITKTAQAAATGEVVDDKIYVANSKWGSHMLLCCGCNKTKVELATHPDNEEVILVSKGRHKSIFIVVAIAKRQELDELIKKRKLSEKNFLALKMVYNDPNLSFFTMLANTPHCEVTSPGAGNPPCFYVTESSELPLNLIDLGEYGVQVDFGR